MNELLTGYDPLIKKIRRLMTGNPPYVSFYDFMRLCLYDEKYGYYMRDNIKIGKEGDYYTSASIGTVMGKMLARAIVESWSQFAEQPFTVEEWGGGDGTLASHILSEIQRHAPRAYASMDWLAIETSDYHQHLQQVKLAPYADRIKWTKQAIAKRSHQPTVVIANELLDAFPVYRVKLENGELQESIVCWSEQSGFYEQFVTVFSKPLLQLHNNCPINISEGQVTEINIDALAWIEQLGHRLERANVFIIDYGDVEDELYACHRMTGTLMCYHQHVAHDNPFIYVGEQDLTTLVNFTACEQAAATAGFENIRLRTQKQFLLDQDVFSLLQNDHSTDPFSETAKMNRAVRQLLLGAQMSERFKVLTMKKGQLSQ